MLILGLALILAGLGPVPLSACALFSAKPAECATPKTQTRCDRMNMDEVGTRAVASASTSCCHVAQAPLPEPQYKSYDLSLSAVPSVIRGALLEPPAAGNQGPAVDVQDPSPPPLQSLLCTFLI
jgi:hypothetical protein